MREIQVRPPKKSKRTEPVHRLQFTAGGATLVATVSVVLFAYDLRADKARTLYDELEGGWSSVTDEPMDMVVSPDGRWLVYNWDPHGEGGYVCFTDFANPGNEPEYLSTDYAEHVGLRFTADGKTLVAVRNFTVGEYEADYRLDVVRFETAALTEPPKRRGRNQQTGVSLQLYYRDLRWKRVMDLPGNEPVTASALSADGRLLAAGTTEGTLRVADLTRKRVLASYPWPMRTARDRSAVRVAFEPQAERVVMLANGQLFAHPLAGGKAWQTKPALGHAHDFAFHPDGRMLCAVFADGDARYLDPRTGAVVQSFKWAKKPTPLHSVCFAPDGLTCAAGGVNGKVILWDVDA